jgi:peptidoglycan/xylan/chitin deacetylase (PgdA/CDA1 family)
MAAAGTLLLLTALAVVALAHQGSKTHPSTRSTVVIEPQGRLHGAPGFGAVRLAAIDARGYARIRRLARLGLPIYCAGAHGNEVAFTFDDGPGPYTQLALKKLTAAHERATFFVVGRSMDFFPGYLPAEMKLASIGDHTYTHPLLSRLASGAIASEIGRTKRKIEAATHQLVYLFRPPYGARNATVDAVARGQGLLEIVWSVDSGDSVGADWAAIIRNVEAGLHPGAIILMHENRGQTIRALTSILPALHRRHIRSVSLAELFASDPPSVAQVRRGRAGCRRAATAAKGNGG